MDADKEYSKGRKYRKSKEEANELDWEKDRTVSTRENPWLVDVRSRIFFPTYKYNDPEWVKALKADWKPKKNIYESVSTFGLPVDPSAWRPAVDRADAAGVGEHEDQVV